MNRKEKLRLYQIIFLISGLSIVLFTFLKKNNLEQDKIISKNLQKKIERQLQNPDSSDNSTFYNVKYSGIDLEGNRYSIGAKEGTSSTLDTNLVVMKGVSAIFYFKDNTRLQITSDEGKYNNQTLDISFKKNVKAVYQNSQLYADEAEFSNSKNFLTVSNNVKIIDTRGTMFADKLIFDIKSKTLNITSLNNKMVRSKINVK